MIVDPIAADQPAPTPPTNGDELPDPDNPIVAKPADDRTGCLFRQLDDGDARATPGDGQVSYYPFGHQRQAGRGASQRLRGGRFRRSSDHSKSDLYRL